MCLNFAISCKSVHLEETLQLVHFVSISITNANLTTEKHFVHTPYAIILNLTHNNIYDISNIKSNSNLFLLDVSFNMLSVILHFTFSNLTKLKYIDLKDNNIYHIESNSFYNISSSFLLNLANNKLKMFSMKFFNKILKLISLVLYNNPIYQVDNMLLDGILINMLLTNNHLICCMKQFKTVCNPHVSWQTSRSPLLLNRVAQSLVMLMFL